jgi:glycosyltransferase involved in cell wall biosynthesis
MMRITFVVPVLEVSGGARIIAGHAQRLAAKGHDVLVVAPSSRPSIKTKIKTLLGGHGSRTYPVRQSLVARSGVPFKIARHSEKVAASDVPEADVIIATWWETAEWISAMPRSKGAKVHFIQHYEAHPGQPADRVDAVWRLPFSKIAVAQWLVDLGRERFGIDHIALVPNSVDHDLFKPQFRQKGHPATVGFLFHPAEFKDMPTTFATLERLQDVSPGIRFVSFGATRPNRGQLPANCEFYHLPQQQQIAEIYRRCDAWLSASRQEGFNLPPLEAMASGCPAVCAKTGRPMEIIRDGVNGYLIDEGDADSFAAALARIISLPHSEWTRMSEAAVSAVAHPTWGESSDLFAAALERSLSAA